MSTRIILCVVGIKLRCQASWKWNIPDNEIVPKGIMSYVILYIKKKHYNNKTNQQQQKTQTPSSIKKKKKKSKRNKVYWVWKWFNIGSFGKIFSGTMKSFPWDHKIILGNSFQFQKALSSQYKLCVSLQDFTGHPQMK